MCVQVCSANEIVERMIFLLLCFPTLSCPSLSFSFSWASTWIWEWRSLSKGEGRACRLFWKESERRGRCLAVVSFWCNWHVVIIWFTKAPCVSFSGSCCSACMNCLLFSPREEGKLYCGSNTWVSVSGLWLGSLCILILSFSFFTCKTETTTVALSNHKVRVISNEIVYGRSVFVNCK